MRAPAALAMTAPASAAPPVFLCSHAGNAIIATWSLWRSISKALVATLVLAAGLTIGDARAGCPASARSPARQAASLIAPRAQSPAIELTSAARIPIWKNITLGEYRGVNAMRAAIDAAPCPIGMGDTADEILGRPGFPFSRSKSDLDLVIVSGLELGFGEEGASLRDIYGRALAIGLDLCPAEAGPVLRLNYLDQPRGEFLHLAMQPVARYGGDLVDLTLGNDGAELKLIGGDGRPEVVLPGAVRFVFVRPRPDATESREPALTDALVKR